MKWMHNFDRRSFAAAISVLALVCALSPKVRAQNDASAGYETIAGQELRVSGSPGAAAGDFRYVINKYWSLVRRYPASGVADNALWQAANLSMESFRRFGDERDRSRAAELFQWLASQYPRSPLAARASAQASEQAMIRPPTPTAPTQTMIRALRREVLPEVVRVTIELDAEVAFYQERIAGPSRLFFDLKSTKTSPKLVDAVLRYDTDIVREIRLGRHANNTTRIVLDLENVGRYSVFTLYEPYRIVIDSERAAPTCAPQGGATARQAPAPQGGATARQAPAPQGGAPARQAPAPQGGAPARQAPAPQGGAPARHAETRQSDVPPGGPAVRRSPAPAMEDPPRQAFPFPVSAPAEIASSTIVPSTATAKLVPVPATGALGRGTAPALKPSQVPSRATARLVPPPARVPPTSARNRPAPAPAPSGGVTAEQASELPTLAATVIRATPAPATPSLNSGGKFSVARQLGLGVSRIVIDAGHGGHDPGASALGVSEAELVLDVSLRLEKLLREQPGVEVVLTRKTNDYLSLEERTEIANRELADLFLSIHANASANASARGVETYFLNFALNPQAEAVAARENAASGRTMNSLPGILKAITLNSKLNESRDFAALIQQSLVRGLRPSNKAIKDLGVKQAPFMVLIGAAMPSVLAEISFVTNQQDARLLKTPSYRQKIAESLLAGILRYQETLKKVGTTAQSAIQH